MRHLVGGGLDGPLRSLPQKQIAPAKPALEQGVLGRDVGPFTYCSLPPDPRIRYR
jgi:hypothetical protein